MSTTPITHHWHPRPAVAIYNIFFVTITHTCHLKGEFDRLNCFHDTKIIATSWLLIFLDSFPLVTLI